MSTVPEIDGDFLSPLESAMLSLETGSIPLLVFAGANMRKFVAQASAALGATVVYASQKDFEDQFRASLKRDETLMVVIDVRLAGQKQQLVNAYLAARDIMGPDNVQLARVGMTAPSNGHRLVLITERAVLMMHDQATQRQCAELCRVIAVA